MSKANGMTATLSRWGRRGGLKGGRARWRGISAEQRRAIMRRVGQARARKARRKKDGTFA